MSNCLISYVPERLHTRERPDIPFFELGEHLYRRCPDAATEKPFSTISLIDVSVNRAGPTALAPLCERDDVLWNFNPTEKQPGERIIGEVAVELTIVELTSAQSYEKTTNTGEIGATQGVPAITCVIQLIHRKESCNYAHCAFELRLAGEEVTYANYKQGLGAKNATYSKLRDWCRQELGKMYLRQEAREAVRTEIAPPSPQTDQ